MMVKALFQYVVNTLLDSDFFLSLLLFEKIQAGSLLWYSFFILNVQQAF